MANFEAVESAKKLKELLARKTQLLVRKMELAKQKKELEMDAEREIVNRKELKNERERKVFKHDFLKANPTYNNVEQELEEIEKELYFIDAEITSLKYMIRALSSD